MNAKKIIIDCDPGIDDTLALMLALCSPELEILGITVVSGNVPARQGAANALKVLNWMNRPDIPVYLGEELPLTVPYADAMDTHGEDGLGDSHYPEVTDRTFHTNGVEFLARTLHQAALDQDPVSVIALGPLTNLAKVIQNDPESLAGLGECVSMGGSYKSHGNCSPVAEYNYWCDPHAAEIVYRAFEELPILQNKKIHMVGLDVTRTIVLTPDLLEYMCYVNPAIGERIRTITRFYLIFTGNRKESSAALSMIPWLSLILWTAPFAVESKPVPESPQKDFVWDKVWWMDLIFGKDAKTVMS